VKNAQGNGGFAKKEYYFCQIGGHQVPAAKANLPCLHCGSLPPHLTGESAVIYVCSDCDYQAKSTDALEICPHCSTLNSFQRLPNGAVA